MKKPNRERLRYLDRIWRRRQYRLRPKPKRRATSRAKESVFKPRTLKVNAPVEFDLTVEFNRSNLLNFIDKISQGIIGGHKVEICFDATKKLLPSGTLYFVASIDAILNNYPEKLSCNYPADEVVEQLFQHIGFLQRLGQSPRKAITADNVRYWQYLTGTSVDLSGFKSLFEKISLENDTKAGLYDGFTEAITNVIQHAYSDDRDVQDVVACKWWMFAQHRNGQLDIAICDLGIGIPNSMISKPELSEIIPRIVARFKKRSHNALIEVAVESNRSRTKLAHRGKGLPDMLSFARTSEIGGFLIHSRRGFFVCNANRTERGHDYRRAITGTLIHWHIPISK